MQRLPFAFIALVFAVLMPCAVRADAPASTYAWVQFGDHGQPEIRAIPVGATCPTIDADGQRLPMAVRIPAGEHFERILCAADYPVRASTIQVDGHVIPRLPKKIDRIAVLADTGCRIKGIIIQNCNDPDAWPFAKIAAAVAREKPDLILHIGDYQYRESGCLAIDPRCGGSPHGDTWETWNADVFAPAAPLFASAPIVFVRGNHEDCKRAGVGWSRYLAPDPSATCRDRESETLVDLGGMRFANVDTAVGSEDDNAGAPTFASDEHAADAQANGEELWLLAHRPPLDYLNAQHADAPDAPHIAVVLAGHIHLFGAFTFAGAPPLVIVGTGGDTLSSLQAAPVAREFHGLTDARFGYTIFERAADGWTIDERDPDGSEHRRCTLAHRTVRC